MCSSIRCGMMVLGAVLVWSNIGFGFTNDPAVRDYFGDCFTLKFPAVRREKEFKPDEQKANFTFFHGVEAVQVTNGVLRFTLSGEKATLGWGNYGGKQAPADFKELFPGAYSIVLAVKAPAEKSAWQAFNWADGRRLEAKSKSATNILASAGATNLTFWLGVDYGNPITADGFELQIEGVKGSVFEIGSVKLVSEFWDGYLRREFTIPPGAIWRAIAYIGGAKAGYARVTPYLNGREIERNGAWLYGAESIDVTSYLRPGVNSIGLHGFRTDHPMMMFCQIKVVMESGEVVGVGMDKTSWKWSPAETAGWNQPGFNDSAWAPATNKMGNELSAYTPLYGCGPMPEYNGQLMMKNPNGRYLFYKNTEDTVIEVHLPKGLKAKAPVLHYLLGQAERSGQSKELDRKMAAKFEEKGGSLVCPLNFGKLHPGVYTLALQLKSGETVLETRAREPFVVVSRHQPKIVEGRDIKEGLDLELEAEIDFTDQKDPHPWVEGARQASYSDPALEIKTPAIVKTNGLVYRETALRGGSSFCYRLGEFKHVGDFYLMELEYPDNAERWADIIISSKSLKVWSNSQSGVGYASGGKFYLTGKMQKLYWIHVADPGVHSVDVVNGDRKSPAAARSLKVYHIKGRLPAIQAAGNRMHGIHTERCYDTSGMGMNFGIGYPKPNTKEWQDAETQRPLLERYVEHLVFMSETADRYVQYLKFAGQNSHIMGCYQYNDGNTPYVPVSYMDAPRIPDCLKSVFNQVADLNDINVYAGLEISMFTTVSTESNNLQVARGADTIWMVDDTGRQFYYYRYHPNVTVQNWVHPIFRAAFNGLMKDLTRTFGHSPHFRGAHMLLGPAQQQGYYPPAFAQGSRGGDYDQPYFMSYDDAGFKQFEADTGVQLPIAPNDPLRFVKRAELMQNAALQSRFRDWRCRKLFQVLNEARTALNTSGRKDLDLVNVWVAEDKDYYKYWLTTGKNYKDFARNYACDLDLYKNVAGLYMGRWTVNWRVNTEQDPYTWLPKENPEIIAAFDSPLNRYVLCRTSWDENITMTGGYAWDAEHPGELVEGSDWIMKFIQVRALPQLAGYNCREALIQAIITADPDVLMSGFTDLNINVGHEDVLRTLMAVYTSLPREKFKPVLNTDLTSNLAIRQLTKEKESYLYVANPGYWQMNATLALETKGKLVDLISGKKAPVETRDGQVLLPVALEPFGLAAFRVEAADLKVLSFTNAPINAAERAHMDRIMARVTQLLDDPAIKIILPLKDQGYMQTILKTSRANLNAGKVALAWSTLKDVSFWSLWQEYLEKAAQAVAFLPKTVKTEKQENITAVPAITAGAVKGAITVDGKLNESEWQTGVFQAGFVMREKKPAFAETAVKVLADRDNLYIGWVCADQAPDKLKAEGKEEKTIMQVMDDVLIMFIQPDANWPEYYQMAFNPKGVQFDQKVIGAERDYVFHPDWQAVVQKENDCWTAEVKIPFNGLNPEGRGTGQWRINFHRLYRDNMVDPCSWSFSAMNFHWPERFGLLKFGE